MSIGNRVFLKRPMPSQELLEGFVGLPAANIADTMGRSCAMNPRIRLMSGFQGIMAGPALTVKARAGDNLFLHQALDMAQPGDVIVLSNDEDTTRSLMGEIMFTYAKYQKKLGGLVIDGPVRDVDALREMDLPVYATGSTPGGPHKEGPGEVNVPIACGGISVHPGDIIVADADGIIVVPLRTPLRCWRRRESSMSRTPLRWRRPGTGPPTGPGCGKSWRRKRPSLLTGCTGSKQRSIDTLFRPGRT